MTTRIKAVVFDLESTIIGSWHRMASTVPGLRTPLNQLLFDNSKERLAFFSGKIGEEEFWSEERRKLDLPPVEELKAVVRRCFTEVPGMLYLVRQVKRQLPVALLSSFPREWYEDVDEKLGLSRFFDATSISGYTGLRKNDKGAYLDVCARLGLKPEECLLVDDSERNVGLARSLGMQTIRFVNAVSLARELKKAVALSLEPPLHIFRLFDVRGIYGLDLTEKEALAVGRSMGLLIGQGKRVFVAHDHRNGSQALNKTFVDGLLAESIDVVDGGLLPTPVYYFMAQTHGFDGGAMITASHNPPEWNGIKMFGREFGMVSGDHGMPELKAAFVRNEFKAKPMGSLGRMENGIQEYAESIASRIRLARRLKVALDPGDGCWSGIAKMVFERLGCDVVEINGKPDPLFRSRGPDPTEFALEELVKVVLEEGADFGAGFDSDGDRAGLIDDKGRYVGSGGVPGSVTIPLFAGHYLERHPGGKVVIDATCSSSASDYVTAHGGTPVLAKSGRAYMLDGILAANAIMGGEYSNHMYFADNWFIDDGCFTAAKLAEILSTEKEPLSRRIDAIPKYFGVPNYELYCTDETKFDVVKRVEKNMVSMGFTLDLTDGVKGKKGDSWVLVRASNTMPQIKIISDGKTKEAAAELFSLGKRLVLENIPKARLVRSDAAKA